MGLKALLIGCNVDGLQFADSDVENLDHILQKLGYATVTVIGNHTVDQTVKNFCDSLSSEDTAIIYFSGHGHVHNQKYYLLLDDYYNRTFNASTIHIQAIITSLDNSNANNKLLILDACRSATAAKYTPDWHGRIKILSSSDLNEPSKEVSALSGSFFTWLLCKQLSGKTNTGLINPQSTVNAIFQQLCQSVEDYNRDHKQRYPKPKLFGEQSVEFEIVPKSLPLFAYATEVMSCYTSCTELCVTPRPFCHLNNDQNNQEQYILPCFRVSDAESGDNLIDACELMDLILDNDQATDILLLGDSGSGKSSFAAYCYKDAIGSYLSEYSHYIPFYFQLDDLQKRGLLDKTVIDIINEIYEFQFDRKQFNDLIRQQKILFILDGFDELSDRADYNKILDNLKYVRKFYHSRFRVVLTCRTHYFANDQMIHEIILGKIGKGTDLLQELDGIRKHFICQLQEFSPEQIGTYISTRRPEQYQPILESISSIYNLNDLARKPLLLKLIVDTLPELIKTKKKINRATLYNLYTQFWIKRELKRRLTNITKNHKTEFMSCLALSLWINDMTSITEEELNEFIHGPNGESTLLADTNFHAADYDVRNCSFLNRDEQGRYKFMHRSFMEYFVAIKCIREIDVKNLELPSWNIQWFDKEVAAFIGELLQLEENEDKIRKLATKTGASNDSIVLWNALHLISLIDNITFDKHLGEKYLKSLENESKSAKDIIILRQYCRIFAKFGMEQKAKAMIKEIINFATQNVEANESNNQTYIRYYQGQKSACQALLNHLKERQPKYDRLLHIYVLGQIGNGETIDQLSEVSTNWTEMTEKKAVEDAIESYKSKGLR